MLDPEHIRHLEMTGGEPPPVDMDALHAQQRLLTHLQAHPQSVRVVQRSDSKGRQLFRLEIRDPQLGAPYADVHQAARADFYKSGLNPMIAEVISHFPHIPSKTTLYMLREPARHCVYFSTSLAISPIEGALPKDRIVRDPVHIMARFLADNGVNYPGSSHFRTPSLQA